MEVDYMNARYGHPIRRRLWLAMIEAALTLTFFAGVQCDAAQAPTESHVERLTLTNAVDLALRQNLDIKVANLETANRQVERAISRSALLPQVGFNGNEAIMRYNAKAQLGVQPAIIP